MEKVVLVVKVNEVALSPNPVNNIAEDAPLALVAGVALTYPVAKRITNPADKPVGPVGPVTPSAPVAPVGPVTPSAPVTPVGPFAQQ